MRQLKFRVWNEREKTMEIPDNIANDIDGGKYQIMQFTGLLDKRGQEIYEGDIVSQPNDSFNRNWVVTWDERGTGYYLDSTRKTVRQFSGTLKPEVEVIGNIWENPELLETKDAD